VNLRLLSIGTSAYAGLILLSWIRIWVYIPATAAIIPSLLLAALGIATAALGLVVKGRAGFNGVRVLMISSLFLGVFGFISWFDASTENYHTADVCLISTVYHDGYEWACPQVQATNQITWILAVSLVIPALLFLVAPYLSLRHRLHQIRGTQPLASTIYVTQTGPIQER